MKIIFPALKLNCLQEKRMVQRRDVQKNLNNHRTENSFPVVLHFNYERKKRFKQRPVICLFRACRPSFLENSERIPTSSEY